MQDRVACEAIINSFSANYNNSRGHLNHYNDTRFKFLKEDCTLIVTEALPNTFAVLQPGILQQEIMWIMF